MTPNPEQYLYSTCKGEDYGRVLAVGVDDNGSPTIDIEVYDPQDIISCDDDQEGSGFGSHPLTLLELPPSVPVILRAVQWEAVGVYEGTLIIRCNTPAEGCYRCIKSFWVKDKRTKLNGGCVAQRDPPPRN